MYESLKDLDRTEFRLKTPHLGPARPHAPTPADTPISTSAPIQPAKQPVKDKQANRCNLIKISPFILLSVCFGSNTTPFKTRSGDLLL